MKLTFTMNLIECPSPKSVAVYQRILLLVEILPDFENTDYQTGINTIFSVSDPIHHELLINYTVNELMLPLIVASIGKQSITKYNSWHSPDASFWPSYFFLIKQKSAKILTTHCLTMLLASCYHNIPNCHLDF